ncbi:PAS domain S-box protein [uncultured Pseudacidovorax sp.]|uniref:PAS domain S-box protein n=1 Tax=uncultured Pseudacidovorax sp. TaxID=679313 RepID=UPI0025CDCBB0|nr:PAS domain S-box protein [uncultured Pseudacidovorax sp.]
MRAAPVPTHWPFVRGESAALARALDHDRCPLGPAAQWPQTLRMLIDMMLPSQAEIVLFWGEDYLAFYNDAYAPTIGNKHPAAFGRPGREHWSELWDDLQPLLDRVLHFGETVAAQDRPFRINRHGQMEEVFFDISYSPVREHDGRICGVLCIVKETTARVNATRRLAASEAHLREMEEQWRLAQAAGGVGVFVLDIPADTITASPGFYRAFGLPAHAGPMPSSLLESLKAPGESTAMSSRRSRNDGSAPLDVEYRIRRADDGQLRWIWRRAEIVRDSTGTPLLMRGVVQDVTVRHHAQATLRESEERFRALAQAVPNQVWTAGADGALDWVNQQVLDYTGQRPDALLGHRWLAVLHPEDRAGMRAAWLQSAETLLAYSTEMRLRRHDGSWRWQLVRAQPVQASDGSMRWIGTTTDIEHQKAAQAQLQALNSSLVQTVEERTRDRDRLWQLSTDVMVIADLKSGRILHVNPAWQAVLGWTEQELLGTSLMDYGHPDELAQSQRELERLGTGLPTTRYESRLRHRDGSYRTLSWTAVPDAPNLHAVGRDVTALRESEARLRHSQKMEAVGQLTGGIAHDFNNMLQGITGAIEVMRRRVAKGHTEGLDRFMDSAAQSATRAASLVQRLLAFSRRQSLDPRPIDVNRLVRSMEEMLRRTLGEHVRLAVELDSEACLAIGDESQLESAILNLAINARDAMPSGGLLRLCSANLQLGDGDVEPLRSGKYVRITVADTGSGMPDDVLAKAFDPFFTTKPIGQGTGLGLSMVYGFAQQSGGHVRIDSKPGDGTSVALYLPCAEALVHDEPAPPQAAAPVAGDGEVVLLVEDDPGVRLLVREVLTELGYRTLEAPDGSSAVPILQSAERIDLLVSDVGLPGLNGRQLAEIARQSRPGLRVLFMTGYAARAAIRSEFLAPGMDMIAKPFAVDELAERIRRMVAGRAVGG